MSSYPKKRIDFSELDDHFDDDQQIDSLRYNAEIDSAIQIKKTADAEKLNDVQQLLQFSPHPESEKQKQKLSSVRCSFGLNSNHVNPTRLAFYQNQGSVNNSLQISSPDTASFPLQKKFLKLYNMRSSIEELSAENDISQSRDENSKKTKKSQNTEENQLRTYNEDEMDEEDEFQQQAVYQYEELLRELMSQLDASQNQLQMQQSQYNDLQSKCDKQQSQIAYLTKLNQEITKTLDETQNQLQLLNETNGMLKKKIQSLKSYSVTEQSQYHGNTNRFNKENQINDFLKHHSSTESTQSTELVNNLKKSQKINNTYSNILMMTLLMIQKCFYLDENLDKEGKDVINKIVSQVNSKTTDNIIVQVECLIKYFEQRFADMVQKCQKVYQMSNLMDQIKNLVDQRSS